MAPATQIIVNGRFLTRPVTGVERFAGEILMALDRLISEGSVSLPPVEIALPPGAKPGREFQNFSYRTVGSRQGHLWEQLDLPAACRGKFLLNLCNTGPVSLTEQAVVVHDAAVFAVPHAYGLGFRLAYRLMHGALARRAKHMWTVSEFSKRELQRYLPLAGKPLVVLPEGGEHVLTVSPDESILDRVALRARPFVLAVSSAQPAKNFGLLVKALEGRGDPGFDVVVAGGTNPAIFSGQGQALPDYVKHVGYVSDAELACLYKNASCFVFPSVYEGFGIPPLEAMSMGCPVVASTAASIPEVCGDAAVYFDPHDPAALYSALSSVMSDPHLRDRLQINAKRRGEYWTWTRAANCLAQALNSAVGGQHE